MRRRGVLGALVYASACSPFYAAAQPRSPVIGFLSVGSPESVGPALLGAFHKGLAEAGYHEGRNVVEIGRAHV